MSAPPWMPLYIADYIADTRHLTARQHGGYMLLLMAYWQAGGRLVSSNATALARLAGMTEAEWAEDGEVIHALFTPDWRHKRADAELAKARIKYEKRAAAGKRGGDAKAASVAIDKQNPSNATSNATASEASNALASSSQLTSSPKGEEGAPRVVSRETEKADKRGSRIPEDFEPDTDEAVALGLPLTDAIAEVAKFKDHWRAKPGKDGVKLDWPATWRNWCRRAAEYRATDGRAAPTTTPSTRPTVWIEADDPAFKPACALYERKTGRKAFAAGSRAGNAGIGFAFPVDCTTKTTKEQAA